MSATEIGELYGKQVTPYGLEVNKNRALRQKSMEEFHVHHVSSKDTCGVLQMFHSFMNKTFSKLGRTVALYPSYFILVPVFLTALGATGFQQLRYVADPEYLFSPQDGRGRQERNVIETLFPLNYSDHFDPSRITRISHFARLLVTAKDNGTMFRTHVWNDLVALDKMVKALTVEYDEEVYAYNQICARWNGKCIENPILEISDMVPELENGTAYINYPIMLFPLVLPFFYGGAEVNESEAVLVSARSISLTYWFREDDYKQKRRAFLFEGKILELLDTADLGHLNVARYVSKTLEEELEENTQFIYPYVAVNIFLMVVFSMGTVSMCDWVRSKAVLGLIGVTSAGFSFFCSFGVLMYIGVPYIGINMAAPFLILGIGIDDMFVILSAWRRTRIQDCVEKRLSETYAEAAVSITITSLTNMISFFVGTITPFPSVQIFCLYTGFSIFMCYVWFITFFGGCLAIFGRMEMENRHSLTFKKVKSKSEAESIGRCYKLWCAGGINKDDPYNPKDNKDHGIMIFFRDYFGKAINFPFVKALVLVCFVVYLAGAIYGCTKVEEGLERRRLALDSSYVIDFFDKEDELYREFPYRLQVVIAEELEYSNPETEKMVIKLHEDFESLEYVGKRIYTQSWLRSFYRLLERKPNIRANITDEVSFIQMLEEHYFKVRNTPERLDVVYNENKTRILASRFIIQTVNVTDANADKDMMEDVRQMADSASFKVIAYHAFFVFFDQYLLVRQTSIQSISIAAAVMMVVALIFIPNPWCSLWVAFSIVSIEIGIIGYMSLWHISLDAISMINLIMCIGFSVDFSAHISYAYLTASAETTEGRVRECLYSLGLPILQGGASTILGVTMLCLAPSYIYQTFFKVVFLVIFFGTLHGILLLPVLLSLLGPGSRLSKSTTVSPAADVVSIRIPVHAGSIESTSKLELRPIDFDSISIEKDLGIGSSGEESNESSVKDSDSVNVEDTVFDRNEQKGRYIEENEGGIQNCAYDSDNDEKL